MYKYGPPVITLTPTEFEWLMLRKYTLVYLLLTKMFYLSWTEKNWRQGLLADRYAHYG